MVRNHGCLSMNIVVGHFKALLHTKIVGNETIDLVNYLLIYSISKCILQIIPTHVFDINSEARLNLRQVD